MDTFEDKIEDYYKDIDMNGFTQLISLIRELNCPSMYTNGHEESKQEFFNSLKNIKFSPNINLQCDFEKDDIKHYDIRHVLKNKEEIIKELLLIKRSYLIGFDKSTPFGTFDFNTGIALKDTYNPIFKNEEISQQYITLDSSESFFKNQKFNQNLITLKEKFGIDVTEGAFIDKLDIQFLQSVSNKNVFSYVFYKVDDSKIKIDQYINSHDTEFDKLFTIINNDYTLSLKPDYINNFSLAFMNKSTGMIRELKVTFDDIVFKNSSIQEYQEFLNSHFDNKSCAIHACFHRKNSVEDNNYNFSASINGHGYDNFFELVDSTNSFYQLKIEDNKEKRKLAFAENYNKDFNIHKMFSKDFIDVLELYDIHIKFNDKYDKLSEKNINLIEKFENIRNSLFYKKPSMTKKNKIQN